MMARMQRLEMEYGALEISAREKAPELQMRARVALDGAGTLLNASAGVGGMPLLWYYDGYAPKERSGKLPSAFALIPGVALLCASCASPILSQTTLPGNSLAYRSTGTAREDNAWRLNENGFVGTYVRLEAAGEVSFTVRASKSSSKKEPPVLRLRVADLAASWPVTAAGDSYGSHTQTWTLRAGTYCVRVENTNDKPPGGPREINVRDLTIAGADVLNAPTDADALAAADTYIHHFRRGPATLTLTRDGRAIANVPVRIRLKRHAFNFGTAVWASAGRGTSWLERAKPEEARYWNFIIDNFNTIVPENGGKWTPTERTRDKVTLDHLDRLMDFAALSGLRVRMHGVLWDVDEPDWVNALQETATKGATQAERDAAKADLRTQISERIQYFVKDHARKYYELDVINEPVHCPVYHQLYGFEGVAGIYNEVKAAVREAGASTGLVPNEYEVLQGPRVIKDVYANWYRKHVERLRNAGGAVDGIGIQYYVVAKRPNKKLATTHSPSRIAQVLHNLATTDLTLSMTEFGVQRFRYPTPERAAELLVETLRICFGHEKMTTFINWGFYEPRMWPDAPKGAFMDAEWKITPAGKAWQQLMGVRNWDIAGLPVWTTDVSLTTDAQGRVNFVGFYGDYEVTSGRQRGELTLTKGTTDYTVVLEAGRDRPR